MENNLLDVFPNVDDLLALSAEDLAGILIEIIPDYLQNVITHPLAMDSNL